MSANAAPVAVEIDTPDESATGSIGARLAAAVPVDVDRALRVHLQGDLGAGKTTLVRGFLRALGVTGVVRSPTYGLLEPYAVAGRTVLHLDLYRLADPGEVASLGLRDHDEPGAIWLIEWAERGGGALPPPDLAVTLAAKPGAHHLRLVGVSAPGALWLRRAGLVESV